MFGFRRRPRPDDRSAPRRTTTGRRPEFLVLEDRRLQAVISIAKVSNPQFLTPANGRLVPVTVTGTIIQVSQSQLQGYVTTQPSKFDMSIIDARLAARPVPAAALQVTDQYRQLEPRLTAKVHLIDSVTTFNPSTRFYKVATVNLVRKYTCTFTVFLQAKVNSGTNGREYAIALFAGDSENGSDTNFVVLVPGGRPGGGGGHSKRA